MIIDEAKTETFLWGEGIRGAKQNFGLWSANFPNLSKK